MNFMAINYITNTNGYEIIQHVKSYFWHRTGYQLLQ